MSFRLWKLPTPFQRVRWKIMVPFLVLTGLFAVFATKNITELVSTSLEDRQSARLVDAARYASDAVAKLERDHLEVVRTIAFTQGVAVAVDASDTAATDALVRPAVVNSRTEHVEVVDADGRRVFGADLTDPTTLQYAPVVEQSDRLQWSIVEDVLSGRQDSMGDKWAQIVTLAGGPTLITAGPILAEDGRIVGAVIVGTRVDSLLGAIKGGAFADLSLYDTDSRLLGTTFNVSSADDQTDLLRGGQSAAHSAAGSAIAHGSVLGRPYAFLNSELRIRNEALGSLSVAISTDGVSTATDDARWRMSLIFGAITLAVTLIGWFLAENLTAPLSRLVFAAKAVSAGDLSARSNVHTGDEIGILGVSFDAMAGRLEEQHLATLGALASAIDARDPYTAGHSVRVGDLSAELGLDLGLPRTTLHHLRVGGLLHDIGKIGVRDTVLLNPGALSTEERRLMEQHPTIGLRILESAHLPPDVLAIVGGHHERLNGSGYPLGLSADELSVFPRIAAVADVYDALTTDRPYRRGMTPIEALRILQQDSREGLIDGEVVAAMHRIVKLWEERRATRGVVADAWVDSLRQLKEATVGLP